MATLPKATKPVWSKETPQARIRTEQDQFYHTPAWRKLRKKYITAFPICAECERKGKVTPGTVIDHITQIKKGGHPLDWNNLQTLCDSCHARKSQNERNKQ